MSNLPTILIIEDEEALLKLYVQTLKDQFDVVTAIDGEIALNILQQLRPSLIVLDLEVPKITGLELLEKIRASDHFKTMPIVVLTNMNIAEIREACLVMGATAFYGKTEIELPKLGEVLRGHLTS